MALTLNVGACPRTNTPTRYNNNMTYTTLVSLASLVSQWPCDGLGSEPSVDG